jgi:hypothetical protein
LVVLMLRYVPAHTEARVCIADIVAIFT